MANLDFYAQLPAFSDFREFSRVDRYAPLPDDWSVVITDVESSTRAIESGHYKDVNIVGAASIVAVLNAVKPVRIPYVFGGDGATLCVPSALKDKTLTALMGAKRMAEKSFNLALRTGLVDVKTIAANGQRTLVAKYRPNPNYEQAMFMGNGLAFAEKLVKNSPASQAPAVAEADFTGFECRWNAVPSRRGETVAILVKSLDKKRPSETVYAEILSEIISIYGPEHEHHPIHQDGLTLTSSLGELSGEVNVKTAFSSPWKRWLTSLQILGYSLSGRWLMGRKVKSQGVDWGDYKPTLIANTDYRKFDGALRMLISGTPEQRTQLRGALEKRRRAGEICFGLHANPSALITCLISNYSNDHVHFVDGSNGGYTLAAKELKLQNITL